MTLFSEEQRESVQTAFLDPQSLWNDLNHFYIREAWLLDDRRFREWFALFTEDMMYFMPRRKNVPVREAHREIPPIGTDLPYYEDDRKLMEVRLQRLESGMGWAEEPPSRTRHLVGNLVIETVGEDEVVAKTGFICYRSQLEVDQSIYAGSRTDVLRREDSEWRIAHRTIVLDANVILDKNISIFF
ncbi:aromatic-ring-hydroxylating dioxygenase subunit beta [Streptomyces fuscichromogenes]|uniref:Hypothetical biphenyl dioxygenase beta subunit n=1 Tax=Streptomyces fuscichromogenes TaxID=1324013 RepID=A0A918CWJ4_9ACTN|nr:3-phenylpropionate/cinnamic acid dioxygenase subunit beta [Streptomyces fuscichromogenes]GGN40271.1 hypothetical biphenyl dioxygenase beta subunit [Streptomyces fuscichromogenes]